MISTVISSWLAGTQQCDWYGVTFDEKTGSVIKLRLRTGLSGFLDPALASLLQPVEIDFEGNSFFGKITAAWVSLPNLVNLFLGKNSLSGRVPEELGELENLERLSLGGGNELTGGLPLELCKLTKLKLLDVGLNFMEGDFASRVGNLTSLQVLDLSYYTISTGEAIAPTLIGLRSLQSLMFFGMES